MKRHELIKHLRRYKCEFLREGGKHSIYWNPRDRKTTSVPRHTEITNKLVLKICKDLGIPTVR